MDTYGETFTEGDWEYVVDEDGTASLLWWLGDVYDRGGADVVVPDQLGGHPVGGIIDDPIGANEKICSLVDDGWIPPAWVTSSPHSPARIWCARNCSDYLYWEAARADDMPTCTYTVLADDTVCIDTWWSADVELEIPATIDGHRVSQIGDGAFAFCEFERVTVPDGVVSIGDCAFRRCENLQSATLPLSVTHLGRYAFDECPLQKG